MQKINNYISSIFINLNNKYQKLKLQLGCNKKEIIKISS